MAKPTRIRRKTAENKTGTTRPAGTAPALARRSRAPEPAGPPAYLQAKLAVSHPRDSAEQEADSVAQQLARTPKPPDAVTGKSSAPAVRRASLEPAITPNKRPTLALKAVPVAENIRRRANPTAPVTAGDGVQREAADPAAGQPVTAETEQRIEARRGAGTALPGSVASEMGSRFNQDFTAVRIHTDSEAADLSAATSARAFTVGNDIFFASGEFAPETDRGRELLAHELTHVVQQDAATVKTVQRAAKKTAGGVTDGNYTEGRTCIEFDTISIPANFTKQYADISKGKPLIRHKAFKESARSNKQQVTWRQGVKKDKARKIIQEVAGDKGKGSANHIFKVPSPYQEFDGDQPRYLVGDLETCAGESAIPSWDRDGKSKKLKGNSGATTSYQVDHIVEQQIGAESETGSTFKLRGEYDEIDNLQLITSDVNVKKMSVVKEAVRDKVDAFRNSASYKDMVFGKKKFSEWETEPLLKKLSVKFNGIAEGPKIDMNEHDVWTSRDIDDGLHLEQLKKNKRIAAVTVEELEQEAEKKDTKSSTCYGIFPKKSGGLKSNYYLGKENKDLLSPFIIKEAKPGEENDPVLLTLTVEAPQEFEPKGGAEKSRKTDQKTIIEIMRLDGSDRVGYFELSKTREKIALHSKYFSPLTIDTLEVLPGKGLLLDGQILPTLPIIGDADIRYRISGNEFALYKTFSAEEINLPSPVSIDDCSLTVSAGTAGIGADGRIDLSIEHLGTGFLSASVQSDSPLAFTGGFDFDSTLFDRAHIEVWYRDDSFGGAGEIAIDKPDKVRGIKKANARVNFEKGAIEAIGTVVPSIPGVEQGEIAIKYSEADGLSMVGKLQLARSAAIHSGSIDAAVRHIGEKWIVSATGTAQPAIPGINSRLVVSYDDGAFTAEFSGAYARGMLSGSAAVGATNRSIGADGRPSGAAAPGAPLVVYGSGAATLQIAPWLQGTAGIRFAPDGEVSVAGEIGLPGQLEIFSRKEISKPLLALATQIPVFPGIVAEVGGNLSALAGIGPGELDRLRIGIEYNPSHEDQTHVTGDAHLAIPAEAGLRLGARAGIGLGIPLASATGGLELGGTLGISGAAEAGVHIDWMPGTGLRVESEGYLHAEPKFKFDVSGYVSVKGLGFSIYDNRWQLAAYELGSNLQFGVRFPIRYREGEDFRVSLDDVTFEVPEVDPAAMVRELGSRIF